MLDVGWTELVVIAVVLIIVVGPKDLPPMLRTFGRMMTKMRGMAGEFRQQFDEALKEADLDDVRKTISDAQRLNPAHSLREAMNPLRQMGNEIKADLQKATAVEAKPQTPVEPSTPSGSETPPAAAPLVNPATATVSPSPATSTPVEPVAAQISPEPEKPKRASKAKVSEVAAIPGKKAKAVAAPEIDVADVKPKTKKTTAKAKKAGDA
ncbi:Sec-independent protein translocase protein TatB [Pararhizobium arenae]|uniref:Sec-independent protein translocase protein TatB n=1 Tax=Pararhizobium arenae TaxID=1856850 RepID=UPI00094B0F9D|nr:Sec-independent protein translocase protein TatB [Pararhizobium arenae]